MTRCCGQRSVPDGSLALMPLRQERQKEWPQGREQGPWEPPIVYGSRQMPQMAASASAGTLNDGGGCAAEALAEPDAEAPDAPVDGEERREPLIL